MSRSAAGELGTACFADVERLRAVDVDHPLVDARGLCSLCFPDGEVPEDVDDLVTGRHISQVHLSDEHEERVDGSATDHDSYVSGRHGLADRLAAEDFGPADLEEFGLQEEERHV